MKVKYLDDIENANHPQVLYWFWTPDMIEEGTYIEELENIHETMSFDLLFMTSRDGLSFFDYDQVIIPFRETVKRAHELNIKIGLQLWRNPEAATLEEALALVVEGEETLDDEGFLEYEAESIGHRDQESLKSEIFKVVLFRKTGEGTYAKGSLVDVTNQCEVLDSKVNRIRLSLNSGKQYAGYTAYLLTAHYHRSPDLFSNCSINSFRKAMDTYADVPFDGMGLDEFKSMPISPPWVAMWHPFRSRLFGASFEAYFLKETGRSLKDTIVEMRYVEEDDTATRIKAINYYFDVLKDGPIRVENFVNDYAKEVYGEDTFIGLHNTYHNKLTNDEIWETGCMWWDLPRDYGHTDEDIAYPVRMGIAYSHPKSVLYDMYYTEGKEMPIYKKAIKDARYNNRIHYHAYNDRRPNRFDMKNKKFSDTITEIERKVKLLNHFDGPHPALDLLIVFGRPALANWYPKHELRNEYDINGGLFIIEKSEALWNAGVMCGLVPSNKIEQNTLVITEDNKIEYNGHTFDSILYLYPEYSKQSTLDFLEACSQTDSLLIIEGEATCDFDGNDCTEQFSRIAEKAEMIDFSVEAVLEKGVAKNSIDSGCRLKDGSVIKTDLNSIINKKPQSFNVEIGGDCYSGKYVGAMAIKVDENGSLNKFVAGGFKELRKNEDIILTLSSESDIVATRTDGELDISVISTDHEVKIEEVNDYKWYQGDLHTHTLHSDGEHTISEGAQIAKGEGLCFLALTDHNTFSQNISLPIDEDFAFIPGMELTTGQGHVNFLGVEKPVKSFKFETVEEVAEMTEEASAAGAYISINHPFVGDRWRWGYEPMTFDAVELWNGRPLTRNEEVIKWWQEQLSDGKKIYITGGSDVHKHGMKDRWYGKGRTYIYANKLSAKALVEALKLGHNGVGASGSSSLCNISIGEHMMGDTLEANGDQLSLAVSIDGNTSLRLKIYGAEGVVIQKDYVSMSKVKANFEVDASSLFYRAEVWQLNDNGEEVNPFFTNPIYIKSR